VLSNLVTCLLTLNLIAMRKIALISLLLVLISFAPKSKLFSQANTSLSNLVAPTAINVNLIPNTTNTKSLGSSTLNWKDIYLEGSVFRGSARFITGDAGSTTLGVNAGRVLDGSSPNTAIGANALYNNTFGFSNTAVGQSAMQLNENGNQSTAIGAASLASNVIGYNNTAIGFASMGSNYDGYENTAVGNWTMYFNTNGKQNTASGLMSLMNNVSGNENTASGYISLFNNRTGNFNTAVGAESINSNLSGSHNTGIGFQALKSNVDGQKNTGIGVFSLQKTKGSNNAAVGAQSLFNNTTGFQNTAIGVDALFGTTTQSRNTGVGYMAGLNAATRSTFLGANSNATAGLTNVTAIGYGAFATSSNQVRIGDVNITSIGGNANWTNFSDGRFKKDIKEDVPGLDFINELRPVTYTLDVAGIDRATKKLEPKSGVDEIDVTLPEIGKKSQIVYTGFIAQEVEKVAKKMNYDFSGVDVPENDNGFYGLRYSDFVVPLTKAVQELSKKNEELEEEVRELREVVKRLDNRSPLLNKASLSQNYPNPFTGSTLVQFNVPTQAASAKIVITNIKGQQLQTISVGKDMQQVTINSGTLPAGNYYYSLWVDGQKAETRKMIIAR
jgi:trimeric autotransporter adhesin